MERRLCFHRRVSLTLSTGEPAYLGVCHPGKADPSRKAGPPGGQTFARRADPQEGRPPTPGRQTPPQEGRRPWKADPQTPRKADPPPPQGMRSMRGRYESYWNAFLLVEIVLGSRAIA